MTTFPPLRHLTLCIDVDSTAFNHESLTGYVDRVCSTAETALREAAIAEIDRITELGMNNQIGFSESLELRAAVIRRLGATRRHIDEYVDGLKAAIARDPSNVLTASFARNTEWIQENKTSIHFLSGGMEEIIAPLLVAGLGIDSSHIHANTMQFDNSARFVGFDTSRLLYRDDGKAAQIKALRQEGYIEGHVVMLGDGGNDFNAKQLGGADSFVAFTEIKNRQWSGPDSGVDYIAANLEEAIRYLGTLDS